MIKNFIPDNCPECEEPLTIEYGKTEDVIKLACKNINCIGRVVKKLQKGISALSIKGLGTETVEKLAHCGIKNSFDLFNEDLINEEKLIKSKQFKKGKNLNNILKELYSVKEIPIDKAILSLQIENIGKTFSDKIGKLFSGLQPDMTGLLLDVREQLENNESDFYKLIQNSLAEFEKNNIKIKKYEKPKPIEIKKITKKIDSTINILDIITKLNWELVDVSSSDCQMLIVQDKNEINDKVIIAKENGIKIVPISQVKLLYL